MADESGSEWEDQHDFYHVELGQSTIFALTLGKVESIRKMLASGDAADVVGNLSGKQVKLKRWHRMPRTTVACLLKLQPYVDVTFIIIRL